MAKMKLGDVENVSRFTVPHYLAHRIIHILLQKPQSILGELQPEGEKGLFGILFGTKKKDAIHDHSIPALKQRKAPIKVEPKVFFANERTFLAWMHISIILAGSSIAILAFSDENTNTSSQVYGIIMLPVAVAFIVYAMYQCKSKAGSLAFSSWE